MIHLLRTLSLGMAILLPSLAQAYIGPGAGLSAIGSLLALIAAVFVAIFGFLWYPIKSWRKRRQAAQAQVETDAPAEPADPTPATREAADPETSARQ